ncbi:DUF998 domain-containing protein [Candidatus Micrarchaeota archaeon]|nr:DUF998 domain-containing protein [Candidatus Micrarchaeota archaeon]
MDSLFERYGRHAGLLSPLIFIILTAAGIANYPGYGPSANYLSDLGVGPRSAVLFNSGIMLSAILGILFSIYLWKRFPPGPAKSGAFMMAAALVFFALLSVFTEWNLSVHLFFAGMFFSLALASLMLVGAGLRQWDGRLAAFSLLIAALILPLPLSAFSPLSEHLAAAALLAWSLGMWAYGGRQEDYMRYEWVWM